MAASGRSFENRHICALTAPAPAEALDVALLRLSRLLVAGTVIIANLTFLA
jgi:hypothetical protein